MKKKFLTIIISLISLLFIITPISNATDETKPSFENFFGIAANFINFGKQNGNQVDLGQLKTGIEPITKIMVGTAYTLLLIATIVIGIKYMISGANKRADLKKKLFGLFLATVIISGAYTIWSIVYNIVVNLENGLI